MPLVLALVSRRRPAGLSICSKRTAWSAAAAPIRTKARKPSARRRRPDVPEPGDHVASAAGRGKGHGPDQVQLRGQGAARLTVNRAAWPPWE